MAGEALPYTLPADVRRRDPCHRRLGEIGRPVIRRVLAGSVRNEAPMLDRETPQGSRFAS